LDPGFLWHIGHRTLKDDLLLATEVGVSL
jgi:hypothetical protein